MAIHLTSQQRKLTNFVSTGEYPNPPKKGKLKGDDLIRFDEFFTNVTKELGTDIYYLGFEEGEHTFTDKLGWSEHNSPVK